MAYAKGKYAKFISDRSGMEFPYNEMVVEWNGARVHKSEFEPKTPQDNPMRHSSDAEPLQFPRPARVESAVATLLPLNPFRFTASSATVTVFEPDHGRDTSDTVRFRDVTGNLFGAAVTEIEDEDGARKVTAFLLDMAEGFSETEEQLRDFYRHHKSIVDVLDKDWNDQYEALKQGFSDLKQKLLAAEEEDKE